ncbi:MFS transporter [Demequina flava]|uniref:MFS transporter n=1 Tax=Demequina flava TaxID=1095025 RepID=UPI0007841022|nr:MFS transporter [Demequina flava]
MTPHGSDSRRWHTLATLCLGFFLLLVDGTIVSVGTPTFMEAFGIDAAAVLWITTAYLFAYAVPLLVTGRLGDRYGPRRLYLVGLGTFIAASAIAGLAPSFEVLVGARVLQGLGAAAMTPQSMAIIARTFAGKELPIAMGLWGTVGGVASISGPLLGGALIDSLGWEWIFLINVPVGAIAFVTAWLWLPVLPQQARTVPLLGIAVTMMAILAVVVGIHEGPAHQWMLIEGWVPAPLLIVGGIALLTWYLRHQRGAPDEVLLPLSLFRSRPFTLSVIVVATTAFAVSAIMIPVMLYLQVDVGLAPGPSSYVLIPMGLCAAVCAPVAGSLVNRIGAGRVAVLGTAMLASTVCAVTVAVGLDSGPIVIGAALAVFGVANSFVWSPLSVIAMVSIPSELAGSASGVFNTQRQVGALLGAAVTAAILAVNSDNMVWTLLPMCVVTIVGAVLAPRLARASAPVPDAPGGQTGRRWPWTTSGGIAVQSEA